MLSTAIMPDAHTVKIQTSKTCEHVELNDLKDEVKRSVLAAALGDGDPCKARNNIGGENGAASDTVGGYYWTVTDNTFYAKSSPDATDYEFYIRFNGAEPAVWVEDADNYQNQSSQAICNDLKTNIFTSELKREYQQYNLHLIIDGKDCLPDYGVAQKTELSRALRSSSPYAVYLTTCLGVGYTCAFMTGAVSLGWGALKEGWQITAACVLPSTVGYLMKDITASVFEDRGESIVGTPALLSAIGGTTIIGTYGGYKFLYQIPSMKRLSELQGVVKDAQGIVTKGGRLSSVWAQRLGVDVSKDAIQKCAGTGEGCDSLKDAAVALKSKLDDLAEAAAKAGDDELAKEIRSITKVLDPNNPETIQPFLQQAGEVLNKPNVLEHIKNLPKLVKDKISKLDKASLCTPAATITGSLAAGVDVLRQMATVNNLKVVISTEDKVAEVETHTDGADIKVV